MNVEECIPRMFKAYFRRFGKNALQPFRDIDYVEYKGKSYGVLSNVNGILAVYRIKNDGALKFINPDWFEKNALGVGILETFAKNLGG